MVQLRSSVWARAGQLVFLAGNRLEFMTFQDSERESKACKNFSVPEGVP